MRPVTQGAGRVRPVATVHDGRAQQGGTVVDLDQRHTASAGVAHRTGQHQCVVLGGAAAGDGARRAGVGGDGAAHGHRRRCRVDGCGHRRRGRERVTCTVCDLRREAVSSITQGGRRVRPVAAVYGGVTQQGGAVIDLDQRHTASAGVAHRAGQR